MKMNEMNGMKKIAGKKRTKGVDTMENTELMENMGLENWGSLSGQPLGLLGDERGSIGVKEIAITVAAIVLIGIVVNFLQEGFLTDRVEEVWGKMWENIQKWFDFI
jgi:hypothetical protein